MIEFRCLGDVRLSGPGLESERVAAQPKRLALLAYLASVRDGFHRRDTLLSLFWPEMDTVHGRAALRTSLHFLRKHLGEDAILTRGDEDVGLNPARIWHDVSAFEEAAREGRHAEALELYRGDFLSGHFVAGAPPFEEWLDLRRGELRSLALTCATSETHLLSTAGRAHQAITAAERACALAPYDETAARLLFGLLDSSGDRAKALAAYASLRRRLARDLEAEPSPETEDLVVQIRRRQAVHPGFEGEAVPTRPSQRAAGASPPILHAPDSSLGRRVLGSLVALAVLAAVALRLVAGTTHPAPGGETTRIVVSQLENATGDRALDYLIEGLPSDVVGRLALIPGVRPTSTQSAPAAVRGDLFEAGLALDADLALSWVLERTSDDVVVRAQLFRVSDRASLWRCDCRLSPEDVEGTENALFGGLFTFLTDGDGAEAPAGHRFASSESRRLYLAARYRWAERTSDGYWEAARLLREAIDRDPMDAEAYAWLSNTYGAMATNGYLAPFEGFPRAEAAALRAIDLDPQAAAGHAALGAVAYLYGRNWSEAEREVRSAIDLDPEYAEAHSLLANILRAQGRYEEGLVEAEAAARLDPLAPFHEVLIGKLLYCLDDERALPQLRYALQWDPSAPMARRAVVAWWVRAGEPDSALATWLEVERTAANQGTVDLIEARQDEGYDRVARAAGEQAVRAALASEERGGYVSEMQFANAYAEAGDYSTALTWLERAVDHRDPGALWIRCNPLFDPVRANPRYTEMERRLGLS